MKHAFSKSARLLRSKEFDAVFALRASSGDRWLVVYGCHGAGASARLGLVVSRKVGNAVVRNRWKRAIREAFRLVQSEFPAIDLVCLPRGQTPPPLRDLQRSLVSQAGRLAARLAKRAADSGDVSGNLAEQEDKACGDSC